MTRAEELLGRLTERKPVGTLYHFTSSYGLRGIVDSGYNINPEAGPREESSVSFTRDDKLNFKPQVEYPEKGLVKSVNPAVRLVVDGEKMSDKYKIVPYNDAYVSGTIGGPRGMGPRRSNKALPGVFPTEAEERVVLPKHSSLKVEPYLISVDIRKRYEDRLADVIDQLERDGIKVNIVDSF